MSPKIPVISPRDMIKALLRAGFFIHRQKGSHVILKRFSDGCRVVVPNHPGDLGRKVTAIILSASGLTPEDL